MSGVGSSLVSTSIFSLAVRATLLLQLVLLGCTTRTNVIADNRDGIAEASIRMGEQPQAQVLLGSMLSTFNDGLSDTNAAMSEAIFLTALEESVQGSAVQSWYRDAFVESIQDSQTHFRMVDDSRCTLRVILDVGHFGIFGQGQQSRPVARVSARARIEKCVAPGESSELLWEFETFKQEPLARSAAGGGGAFSSSSAGLIPEQGDLQFIFERISSGLGVVVANQLNKDISGRR